MRLLDQISHIATYCPSESLAMMMNLPRVKVYVIKEPLMRSRPPACMVDGGIATCNDESVGCWSALGALVVNMGRAHRINARLHSRRYCCSCRESAVTPYQIAGW